MGDYAVDDTSDPLVSPCVTDDIHHINHNLTNSHNNPRGGMYTIREQPLGAPKHLRIVCVGAGVSGINLLRTLRLNLQDYEAVVYEKNENVGGTWFENRYPGCKCDIPSHSYQYSWRQNKEWSNFFAPAEEISTYLCRVCEEEDLMSSIRLSHQVVAARWMEASGLWHVTVKNAKTGEQFHDTANFLINGCGILK